MRVFVTGSLALAAVLASQQAFAQDKVVLALNWNVPYSGWAGFYVAQDKGFFEAENLDVEFLLLRGSNPVNQAVAAGSADLGVSTASSVLVALSEGLPLTAVSAYMQSNPEAVVARHDAGIVELSDFVGKRIGYTASNPTIFLFEAKLARAGVDREAMTWIAVQPEALIPLLLQNEVDAVMEYWDWGAINAEREGLPVDVFVMSDDEIQIYGPIVSANTEWAEAHGDVIRRFLKASVEGWIAATSDPDYTLDVMMAANPEEDREFMRAALAVSMQLIGSPDVVQHGFGWMDAADWAGLQDALLKGEVIENEVDVETIFTNDYLPDNALEWGDR